MGTSLPFPLGQTYFKGETVDTDAYDNVGYIGQEYLVKTAIATTISGNDAMSRVRVVQNSSGVALPAGVPVQLNADKTKIVGLGSAYNQKAAAVDGYLTSSVPVNDLCYVFVEGPALVRTPDVNTAVIAVGDPLTAKTIAASSNATSAGFASRPATSSVTDAVNYIDGTVARAISAATTAETSTLKAAFMDIKWS